MKQSKKQLYESTTRGLLVVGITAKCFSENCIEFFIKKIPKLNKTIGEKIRKEEEDKLLN